MDVENPRKDAEARNGEVQEMEGCQGHGQKEGGKQENLPLLAAYGDASLSLEAAHQLARMAEDASHPAYAGEDLPTADKAALLRKAALQHKSR